MGKQKEHFIAIQNLMRCVEYELNNLEIEGKDKRIFLNDLSTEISMLKKNKLEPFRQIEAY